MIDIVDKATRSRMMSGIRGRDTAAERKVRSFLHKSGLRFRLHTPLPGKPDLLFPRYRAAVFVHGCFWHRHGGCRFATDPASNVDFWRDKFAANVARDVRVSAALGKLGWRVITIWECQLNDRQMQGLRRRIIRVSR
ncbi:MAG: DNA mismatch endonuclease Vsr [Acidobacteriales bacterium]|nr:DNA mismatch endonuclease Vsr [Terriglobales bacterium]